MNKTLKRVSIGTTLARTILMKNAITCLVVFTSMFVLGAMPSAQARQCSNASLKGAYGFLDSHTNVLTRTPFSALGRWNFDGKGSFTNTVTLDDNGTSTHANDSGPYTVNADCTGKIGVLGGAGNEEIVLVDGGNEFYSITTNPSYLVSSFSVAKKQFPDDFTDNDDNSMSKRHARQCSNATLKGAYGFLDSHTAVPAGTPFASLGRWNFDGKGNFTNTVTLDDNGTSTQVNDFGPYSVNADCTGTIGILGGTGTVEFVLVGGGKEFYSLTTNPSYLVSSFSVAKKQSADNDDHKD